MTKRRSDEVKVGCHSNGGNRTEVYFGKQICEKLSHIWYLLLLDHFEPSSWKLKNDERYDKCQFIFQWMVVVFQILELRTGWQRILEHSSYNRFTVDAKLLKESSYTTLTEPCHEIMVLFVLHKLFFFKCACAAIHWGFHVCEQQMTAQMRRLAWAFAGRLCDKYHNLMSWFN